MLPPKIGVVTVTLSPSTAMSMLFVSTVRSSLTDSRAIDVAALVVLREQDQVGRSPPSITAFIAAATATPGSVPPRSPVA